MSEHFQYGENNDPVAQFHAAATRDRRVREIADLMTVEDEFLKSATLRSLVDALEKDAIVAMQEFCTANPGNVALITDLQSRVYAIHYIKALLTAVRQRIELAHEQIRSEDGARAG